MSDVTRNKSKRWADAKVPSYGDDWGESSESEEAEQVPELPQVPLFPQGSAVSHNEQAQIASLEEQLNKSNISDSDSDSQLDSDPDLTSDERINRKGTVKGLWKPISSPPPALPQLNSQVGNVESIISDEELPSESLELREEPIVVNDMDKYGTRHTSPDTFSASFRDGDSISEDDIYSRTQLSDEDDDNPAGHDNLNNIDLTKDEFVGAQASEPSVDDVDTNEHDLNTDPSPLDESTMAPQSFVQNDWLQDSNYKEKRDSQEEFFESTPSNQIVNAISNGPDHKERDQGFKEDDSLGLQPESDAIDVDDMYADSEREAENSDIEESNQDNLSSSSGSLSTGNWSISSDKFVAEVPQSLERTASEMSAPSLGTRSINLGHWRPETETHRDQFISNLSDRESTIFPAHQSDNETIDNVSSTSVEDLQHSGHSTIHSGHSSGVLDTRTPDGVFQEQSHHSSSSNVLNESSEEDDALNDDSFESSSPSTHALQNLHSSKSPAIPESSEWRPTYDLTRIMALQNPEDKLTKLRDARHQEFTYQTGLMVWLRGQLTKVDKYNLEQEVLGPHARKAYENVNTGAYHAPSHQLSDLARKHSINFGGGSLLHKKLVHKLAVREKVSETGSLAKGLFGRKKKAKS